MFRAFVFLSFIGCVAPVSAQTLQPGEWEFTAVTTSPLFPGAQNMTFKHCVKKEDADNPERWMARQNQTGECKLTPKEKTASSMSWDMVCPRTNMRGTGIARLTGPGTVESELRMTSEIQGHRIEMNTRTTGRRIGPCGS